MSTMSSDSDFEREVFSSTYRYHIILHKNKRRKYGTHPINEKRNEYGEFHHLYSDLRAHPEKFFEYMRMTTDTFDFICDSLDHHISKKWQNCHARPISTPERLMVTIRYLSTGMSFRGLAFSFRMGVTTISQIVYEMVTLIWNVFQPKYMKIPTEVDFKKIAQDYYSLWNFPNCVGTIDGKHVRINSPEHSGSMYYNYKQYFSIVLQALVDANYKFINIDVGGYGKQSDGGTFRHSALYHMLISNKLHLPEENRLPDSALIMPYVILGDEAYPLLKNLLKPYSKQHLDADKEYFNARLSRARRTVECAFGIIYSKWRMSRARRTVECAFGIIYSKWRILSKAIETKVTTADRIVKAICVLHNIIISREGVEHHLQDITFFPSNNDNSRGRPTAEGLHIRDTFKIYLCQHPIVKDYSYTRSHN